MQWLLASVMRCGPNVAARAFASSSVSTKESSEDKWAKAKEAVGDLFKAKDINPSKKRDAFTTDGSAGQSLSGKFGTAKGMFSEAKDELSSEGGKNSFSPLSRKQGKDPSSSWSTNDSSSSGKSGLSYNNQGDYSQKSLDKSVALQPDRKMAKARAKYDEDSDGGTYNHSQGFHGPRGSLGQISYGKAGSRIGDQDSHGRTVGGGQSDDRMNQSGATWDSSPGRENSSSCAGQGGCGQMISTEYGGQHGEHGSVAGYGGQHEQGSRWQQHGRDGQQPGGGYSCRQYGLHSGGYGFRRVHTLSMMDRLRNSNFGIISNKFKTRIAEKITGLPSDHGNDLLPWHKPWNERVESTEGTEEYGAAHGKWQEEEADMSVWHGSQVAIDGPASSTCGKALVSCLGRT